MVSLDFSVTYSFRPFHGPEVDSAPSENKYQEHFPGVKAAGGWGWRPHHLHVQNDMKIWRPKPPGTLWATPGLLRDCFTFYLWIIYGKKYKSWSCSLLNFLIFALNFLRLGKIFSSVTYCCLPQRMFFTL